MSKKRTGCHTTGLEFVIKKACLFEVHNFGCQTQRKGQEKVISVVKRLRFTCFQLASKDEGCFTTHKGNSCFFILEKIKKSGWNSWDLKLRFSKVKHTHRCLCVHVSKNEFPAKTGPESDRQMDIEDNRAIIYSII